MKQMQVKSRKLTNNLWIVNFSQLCPSESSNPGVLLLYG